jgi:hypothetical protein
MNQLKKNISIQSNKFGSECGLDGYYGDVLCMMASMLFQTIDSIVKLGVFLL